METFFLVRVSLGMGWGDVGVLRSGYDRARLSSICFCCSRGRTLCPCRVSPLSDIFGDLLNSECSPSCRGGV